VAAAGTSSRVVIGGGVSRGEVGDHGGSSPRCLKVCARPYWAGVTIGMGALRAWSLRCSGPGALSLRVSSSGFRWPGNLPVAPQTASTGAAIAGAWRTNTGRSRQICSRPAARGVAANRVERLLSRQARTAKHGRLGRQGVCLSPTSPWNCTPNAGLTSWVGRPSSAPADGLVARSACLPGWPARSRLGDCARPIRPLGTNRGAGRSWSAGTGWAGR
jgi:hypothetical protein